jgi:hypothetical protein
MIAANRGQVVNPVDLGFRQPAAGGSLHLDPQPPLRDVQIRHARYCAFGLELCRNAQVPLAAIWDGKYPNSDERLPEPSDQFSLLDVLTVCHVLLVILKNFPSRL